MRPYDFRVGRDIRSTMDAMKSLQINDDCSWGVNERPTMKNNDSQCENRQAT